MRKEERVDSSASTGSCNVILSYNGGEKLTDGNDNFVTGLMLLGENVKFRGNNYPVGLNAVVAHRQPVQHIMPI